MVLGWGAVACDGENGTNPGNLRFGWIGEVTLEVAAPRSRAPHRTDAGELSEVLVWRSDGFWSLRETISYKGLLGDENVHSVSAFGDGYARFITQVNDIEGLSFVDINTEDFFDGVTYTCLETFSRIVISITDDARGETRRWQQCAKGSLSQLVTQGAGDQPEAARLVSAILLARDLTVGEDYTSVYEGSVPFGTLDRGEDSPARRTTPFVVTDQTSWSSFWLDHAGSTDAPSVDFDTEMIVVGAVGERGEAGDSVEVRRILEVFDGTLTHLVERIPGDFCSPIARAQYPFHIVVSPRTPDPIRFAEVDVEFVPCGG